MNGTSMKDIKYMQNEGELWQICRPSFEQKNIELDNILHMLTNVVKCWREDCQL